MNKDELFNEVVVLIRKLRRKKDVETSWRKLYKIIETNIDHICETFNTRWLVSVCDTYVDYGDPVISRNAMLVVQITNFEKLWATNLLMYDVNLNEEKLKELKKSKVIPLWDGMYSFNINYGDMINNFFRRVDRLMKETPVIEKIYYTILERMKANNTTLANLNKYHIRLFDPYRRRSIFLVIRRKIKIFLRQYKL